MPQVEQSTAMTLGGQTIHEEWFRIKSMFPSPHIIDIPTGIPDQISDALCSSFHAFWFDKGLAANAIRRSLEELVSHFGIPDNINGNWVPLAKRLNALNEDNPKDAEFLQLIRPILNYGSHSSTPNLEEILDVYEAYELYLAQLFSDREARFEALKVKLASTSKDGNKAKQ